jgi:diguanylate cyclase (GGDEF)-like protein/PAS domain S-box-containing protein
MTDRTELMEAALDSLPEGIALVGAEGLILFWNQAAEEITGQDSMRLLARPAPEHLEPLLGLARPANLEPQAEALPGSVALVHTRHKLGHDVPVIARTLVLRDGLGMRIGTATVFHPAESVDALPHGESGGDAEVGASQAELEERLEAVFEDFTSGGPSFGLLWIAVDQASELRRTHGLGACEAMLEKVERVLGRGLRPGEALGRWGDDEFLVISHERSPEMLSSHAQVLAGLARTAEFRWWGDRVSLTVSIGAAQVEKAEPLANLLERAKSAMFTSFQAGGNHIAPAPGGQECLPS